MAEPKPSGQVRIQLSTRNPELELSSPPGPFLVSTSLNRDKLSTLVNDLLEPSTPLRFDFLISGHFLRTDLSTYLTAHGISAETTLDVEYLHALTPPTHKASFAHDDWVGSVDVLSETSPAGASSAEGIQSGHERIVSGSYDGVIRVWSMSGTVLAASKASQSVWSDQYSSTPPHVLATKFISPSSIVSAGADMRLHLWNYTEQSIPDSTLSLTPTLTLTGHIGNVNSLTVHIRSHRILSASSDHTARLWSSSNNQSDHAAAPSHPPPRGTGNKRQKLQLADAPRVGPLATLRAHTRPVNAALFLPSDPTAAYTASDDRTLRTWDLTTSTAISSRTPAPHTPLRALTALEQLQLVAAGTSSGSTVLVDPREGAQKAAVGTLVGHTGMVNALAAEPGNTWGLVSASNDGICRVWDVRNVSGGAVSDGGANGTVDGIASRAVKATYKIPLESAAARARAKKGPGEAAKVFDVLWDARVGIVLAGEDCCVQVNKGERGAS